MQTRTRGFTVLLTSLGLAAAAAFWSGCEHNADIPGGSDEAPRFVIKPGGVTLDTNETSVALRVEGGKPPFTWSVSDAAMGAVTPEDPTDARTANYTRAAAATPGLNTVTVEDSRTWHAEAVIVQQ